ncbi:MAG: amidohydrolase family protein [Acidobacteria bacterium]|nr:amidohydrolase family protein [Acidobacteriota bacterium]
MKRNNKTTLAVKLLPLVAILALSHALCRAQDQPDVIFHNGYVLTVDTDQGDFTVAQAMALGGGKILAVGSNDDVLKLVKPETKKIDLAGKTVVPGFINTHIHPHRDAVINYTDLLPPEFRKYYRATGMMFEWQDKKLVLDEMKRIVAESDPKLDWIVISGRPMIGGGSLGPTVLVNAPVPGMSGGRGILFHDIPKLGITQADLDRVSPDKPLLISLATGGLMNSKALETARKRLPGRQQISVGTIINEVFPKPPAEALARLFERQLGEEVARLGYTTVSTTLAENEIVAMGVLDKTGRMPVRLAFAQEPRSVPLSEFDRMAQHLKEVQEKYNSDMLWMSGVTGVPLDGSPDSGEICASYSRLPGLTKNYYFDQADCYDWNQPNDGRLEFLRRLNRLGFRFSNMHSYGDLALEQALTFYKTLDKDKPLKGRRFAFDHTQLLNPRVVEMAREFGVMWSVSPIMLAGHRTQYVWGVFGKEKVDRWVAPVRALVEAGLKVSYEAEFTGANPMVGLQMLVTRTDAAGVPRGPSQAVDRRTALRIMTRWGAEYVLREDRIGSLEKGKYADLLVLDRNPLDPALPADELTGIKILMTMVGGKVVYKAADFLPL